MTWLFELFKAITAVFTFSTKVAPSEKIQEERFEIKKARLTLREWDKILLECKMYLDLHPRQKVDSYVNLKFDDLAEDDREDLRKALKELFPKR